MDEAQKNLAMGVIAGSAVMVVLDLLVPFAGPIIGGFTAGYLAKGDVMNSAKAGILAGLLAAVIIALGLYQRVVNTPGTKFLAGWGTGLTLYFIVALYFLALAFLGAILTTAVRK